MGIESDQVVFEYLSRVGDVAQQRQLPSATRMRLVSELRNEIDRHRAKTAVDSPAAVRRILDRLGDPDDVVTAAGGTSGVRDQAPAPTAVPEQRDPEAADPQPRRAERRRARRRPEPEAPAAPEAAAPPHLAGAGELGEAGDGQPDWWRVDDGPFAGMGLGDSVPGFVGGVEIPELLRKPPSMADEAEKEDAAGAKVPPEEAEEPAVEAAGGRQGRRLPRLWPEGGWNNPLLLFAAALLIAGAVLGSLVPLGLGWLIAYLTRRLTPAQSKWAVLGLPGTVAAAGAVWLWGRTEGRWGDPVAEGHLSDAVADTWPWVLRSAAVATALYLLWRSRRPHG
ncbi:membrane protein [Streptomyces sp. NRRL F-5650]|uniref:membrane protein n=1 Tax=Streptomyces sp. NRRL F-5650 TaxID=1463868 RepID=UPI0004C6A264|nr:membrane protein [Streptomyces sp. NRRL F-5650]